MRIGWICCRNEGLRAKLLAYKTTEDLHTNIFCQMVLAQYLQDNDLDAHIDDTKKLYKAKADCMALGSAATFLRICSFAKKSAF